MSNKILLADDSITIQKVVNLTFTDEGINVVTVGNGELALKKLNEEEFDLVLADIFMPGRNGYEVCEYVKTNSQTAHLPVILLVGAFEPFDKSEAARVRADGHLTKPFESRILVETVKRMLAEAAAQRAQSAPPSQDSGAGYRGQVVGWDVPTQQVAPQHLQEEEPEPEPPPYDPYASTAKLPPIAQAFHQQPEEPFVGDGNTTLNLGAPMPTGALFSSPGIDAPADLFEYDESKAVPTDLPAHAIEGPPDSVPGFSFNRGSGPLPETEIAQQEGAPAEPPSIGYQELQPTDSPLDLPDMGVVETHTHEPAHIAEVRDPLLETFADVAESTMKVDSSAAPGLEVNVHEETAPSMTIGATEGIISAWDPQAQPERSPEPPPEPAITIGQDETPEPAAAPDDRPWQTQPFNSAMPFGFSEEPTVDASPANAPFGFVEETPEPEPEVAEGRAPSKPTVGLADLPHLSTMRSGPSTERLTPEDFHAFTSTSPTVEESAIDEAPVAEVGPSTWEPEIEVEEPAAEVVEEAAEPVVEEPIEVPVEAPVEATAEEVAAAVAEPEAEIPVEPVSVPVNGSGAGASIAISKELLDEIVRRTVERINDDVIREIAWEVVPDLAEQLIKKRLNRNR